MHQISPRIFPGHLHPSNEGAIDWGFQNLIAYGCQSSVVILDPQKLNIIQTLDGHSTKIKCVRWSNSTLLNDSSIDSYKLKLASADEKGIINIWNVLEATIICTLSSPEKDAPILQIFYHPRDSNLLISLQQPNTLTLWNIQESKVIWRIGILQEAITTFFFSHFNSKQIYLYSAKGQLFEIDNIGKTSSPKTIKQHSVATTTIKGSVFKSFVLSPSFKNTIYFVFSKEVRVHDLALDQKIGSFLIERNHATLVDVLLCQEEPTLLIARHSDGCLSLWRTRPNSFNYDFVYITEHGKFSRREPNTNDIFSYVSAPKLKPFRVVVVSPLNQVQSLQVKQNKKECFLNIRAVNSFLGKICSISVSPTAKLANTDSLVALGCANGSIQIVDANTWRTKKLIMTESKQIIKDLSWLDNDNIIYWSSLEDGKKFNNVIAQLNVNTGRCKVMHKGLEMTPIRCISLSPLKYYMLVLKKDKPLEVWNLKTFQIIGTPTNTQITSVKWRPPASSVPTTKEQFLISAVDSSLHFFAVDQMEIKLSTIMPPLIKNEKRMISAIAWSGFNLVTGDTEGCLEVFDLKNKTNFLMKTASGTITKIKFSPSERNNHIMVLFKEGNFGVWDIENKLRISKSDRLYSKDVKAFAIGWITEFFPIVATNEGFLRILDKSLEITDSPLFTESIPFPISSPHLLNNKLAMNLKAYLLQGLKSSNTKLLNFDNMSKEEVPVYNLLKDGFLKKIENLSIPERSLYISKFYGDESGIQFWSLVSHFVKINQKKRKVSNKVNESFSLINFSEKKETSSVNLFSTEVQVDNSSTVVLDINNVDKNNVDKNNVVSNNVVSNSGNDGNSDKIDHVGSFVNPELEESFPQINLEEQLPIHFNLLRSGEEIKETEKVRVHCFENCRSKDNLQMAEKSVLLHVYLNEKDTAVDILLQTPTDDPLYYQNALKACLISSSVNKEFFENTMKKVSTNLVSCGMVDRGVELLCLIGSHIEACRHLQNADRWRDAGWLAKVSLPESECSHIMRDWASLLQNMDSKQDAIEVFLSLGEFGAVIYLLSQMKQLEFAVSFVLSLEEAGILEEYLDQVVDKESNLTTKKVIEEIFLEYGMYLFSRLGNEEAAIFHWKRAGGKGETMITTVSYDNN